jgi:hypothetical protein
MWAVFLEKLSPPRCHGNECATDLVIVMFDEATIIGIFPYGQAGA